MRHQMADPEDVQRILDWLQAVERDADERGRAAREAWRIAFGSSLFEYGAACLAVEMAARELRVTSERACDAGAAPGSNAWIEATGALYARLRAALDRMEITAKPALPCFALAILHHGNAERGLDLQLRTPADLDRSLRDSLATLIGAASIAAADLPQWREAAWGAEEAIDWSPAPVELSELRAYLATALRRRVANLHSPAAQAQVQGEKPSAGTDAYCRMQRDSDEIAASQAPDESLVLLAELDRVTQGDHEKLALRLIAEGATATDAQEIAGLTKSAWDSLVKRARRARA